MRQWQCQVLFMPAAQLPWGAVVTRWRVLTSAVHTCGRHCAAGAAPPRAEHACSPRWQLTAAALGAVAALLAAVVTWRVAQCSACSTWGRTPGCTGGRGFRGAWVGLRLRLRLQPMLRVLGGCGVACSCACRRSPLSGFWGVWGGLPRRPQMQPISRALLQPIMQGFGVVGWPVHPKPKTCPQTQPVARALLQPIIQGCGVACPP